MQPNIIGLLWISATTLTVSKELLGEWTQVASTRQYCPSQNDINRPLRMAAWMSKRKRPERYRGGNWEFFNKNPPGVECFEGWGIEKGATQRFFLGGWYLKTAIKYKWPICVVFLVRFVALHFADDCGNYPKMVSCTVMNLSPTY